jgi:hypothetical protein
MSSNSSIPLIQRLQLKRQEFATEEDYIRFLETFIVQINKNIDGINDSSDKLILNFGIIQREFIESKEKLKEFFILVRKLIEESKKDSIELSKFKGKKVSKTRMKIYEEIKKKYSELNKEGANVGYKTATNIIANKHKKTSEKLYQAFKKWQIRQNTKTR